MHEFSDFHIKISCFTLILMSLTTILLVSPSYVFKLGPYDDQFKFISLRNDHFKPLVVSQHHTFPNSAF